jgi:hypothetical protein
VSRGLSESRSGLFGRRRQLGARGRLERLLHPRGSGRKNSAARGALALRASLEALELPVRCGRGHGVGEGRTAGRLLVHGGDHHDTDSRRRSNYREIPRKTQRPASEPHAAAAVARPLALAKVRRPERDVTPQFQSPLATSLADDRPLMTCRPPRRDPECRFADNTHPNRSRRNECRAYRSPPEVSYLGLQHLPGGPGRKARLTSRSASHMHVKCAQWIL